MTLPDGCREIQGIADLSSACLSDRRNLDDLLQLTTRALVPTPSLIALRRRVIHTFGGS